jgi:hypothetical protein
MTAGGGDSESERLQHGPVRFYPAKPRARFAPVF